MTTTPTLIEHLVNNNNKRLLSDLIPKGYTKYQKSKIFDEAFNKPIEMPSYEVDKLITAN